MAQIRIKICGITTQEDALLAAQAGADFIGLNFVGGPRKITVARAAAILQTMPASSTPVGLADAAILDAEPSYDPLGNLWDLQLTSVQLYGQKCTPLPFDLVQRRFHSANWWIVRHVTSRKSLSDVAAEWAKWPVSETLVATIGECATHYSPKPGAFLLDTSSPQKLGGTGQSFNWHWIAEARDAGELNGLPPIILAGGLTPDNVAEAIRIARPYAVDVSSGVEVPGKPGIKDPIKMRDFIQAAQGA